MSDILYKDLSYKIIGVLFDVYNEIGPGFKEKYYQKAIEAAFKKRGIQYKSLCPYKITYREKFIGIYYMDFIVEDKIVIELKRGDYFSRNNITQLKKYLQATNLKLGMLVNFTSNGLKYKRIVNLY